jgi:hypothetical protein
VVAMSEKEASTTGHRNVFFSTKRLLAEERILAQLQEAAVDCLRRGIQDTHAFGVVQVIILKVRTISLFSFAPHTQHRRSIKS